MTCQGIFRGAGAASFQLLIDMSVLSSPAIDYLGLDKPWDILQPDIPPKKDQPDTGSKGHPDGQRRFEWVKSESSQLVLHS